MIVLGAIAGFSPTLYATQAGISTSSKRARSLMIALMVGVLLGIILLTVLFQFLQPDALHSIIDNAINALFVSVLFNIFIGILFIIGGLWYIHRKPNRIDVTDKPTSKSSYMALVSLGFFRTFASVSGATAIFLASTLISNGRNDIFSRLILTIVFLVAAVAPFLLILITMKRYPKHINELLDRFKTFLRRFNYKLIIGTAAILIGSAIVIFNVLKAVTF